MYLGEINHKTKSYPGDHAPLIDPDLFTAVQAKLDANTRRTEAKTSRSGALLLGRLFDDRGNPMSPSHATKGNVRYCYYVSTALVQGRKAEAGKLARIPAHAIEDVALKALRAHGVIETDDADPGSVELFKHLDLRVDVTERLLQLTWMPKKGNEHTRCKPRDAESSTSYASDGTSDADPDESSARQTVTIPFVFQTHKRRREILIPDAGGNNIRPIRYSDQQNLVRSIAQARAWVREVIAGTPIAAIASREGKERSCDPHDAIAGVPRSEASQGSAAWHLATRSKRATSRRCTIDMDRAVASYRIVATELNRPSNTPSIAMWLRVSEDNVLRWRLDIAGPPSSNLILQQ